MWTVHDSCLPAVASCLGVDILFTDYGEETSLRLGHMARWCGAQYRQVRRQLGVADRARSRSDIESRR